MTSKQTRREFVAQLTKAGCQLNPHIAAGHIVMISKAFEKSVWKKADNDLKKYQRLCLPRLAALRRDIRCQENGDDLSSEEEEEDGGNEPRTPIRRRIRKPPRTRPAISKLRRCIRTPPKTRCLRSANHNDLTGAICLYDEQLLALSDAAPAGIADLMRTCGRDFVLLVQPHSFSCIVQRTAQYHAESTSTLVAALRGLVEDIAATVGQQVEYIEESAERPLFACSWPITSDMYNMVRTQCSLLARKSANAQPAMLEPFVYKLFKLGQPVATPIDAPGGSKGSPMHPSNLSPKRISNPFPAKLAEMLDAAEDDE